METYLDLDVQCALAGKLSELAARVALPSRDALGQLTRKDSIAMALMEKARISFDAVQLLCKHLFVGDARATIRTMCEATINGAYLSSSRSEVADDYADFADYWKWIEFTELKAAAPDFPSPFEYNETEQMKAKYELIRHRFEKFRRGEWCADNLFKRAVHLDSLVGGNSSLFRWLVNLIWRQASAYAHGAPQSIGVDGSSRDPRSLTQRTPEEAARTVHIASNVMLVWFACFSEYLRKGWEESTTEIMEQLSPPGQI